MATTSVEANTGEGSSAAKKTPAQLLQEEHETHNPTVEEVVDEEDIAHPPPSAANAISEKAKGKMKEVPKTAKLDTESEEAFPSLGPAAKPAPTVAPGWGSRGGPGAAAARSSSGVPTPTSGANTPAAGGRTAASAAGRGALPGVNLPGKYSDFFEIAITDIDRTKPIEGVLQDVRRKYKVNARSEDAGFSSKRRFVAEGPKNQVTEALIYISKEISVEKRVKIEVPASVSASIIGKGGANIRQMESQYGVKIHIDRDQRPASSGPDDPRIDTVEIVGHAAATQLAHEKILGMVKQLQPKIDLPLRNIPPEFYPFIKVRHADQISKLEQDHDLRIQIPQFHTWSQQPPPRPMKQNQPPAFVPHGDSHIVLSGEQAAVTQARRQLEQITQQLQQELLLSELACEQILHAYVIGERGMDPQEFLRKTGCAIVLPPPHHETEDIHIIGPADKIEAGINLATELMAQKQHRTVDLQKQFSDAPMGSERHSRALARYLQKKAIEREFQDAYNTEIVFPSHANAAPTWAVVSDDAQTAMKARGDLSKITQAYPSSRMSLFNVDPFFHQYLEQMHAQELQKTHGVHLMLPEDDEDAVILIFEGPEGTTAGLPRARPTSPEVKEFERALQAAQAQILSSLPTQDISADNFEVPRKFHDRVRRFVKTDQTPQAAASFPVEVNYGTSRAVGGHKVPGARTDSIFLRGPDEQEIAELRHKIEQFLIGVEQDEKERGHITTVDFPKEYVKNLIGKQGSNIKALREKYDVEIDSREEGKIKIQGPPKRAEACKAEIVKLGKQYADEVNYVLKIDPKFHGEIIGKNGENLQKLQSKYDGVRIDFPKVARGGDDKEGGSEPAPRQAADEVRVRGSRAKADKARDELLDLAQYSRDKSNTATVSVAKDQIASLIGRGGSEMEKLRLETGAQIDVPNRDSVGEDNRVTFTIRGTKGEVEKAKIELQKRSKAFDAIATKTITVDKKHHRALIGSGGANIRRIVVDAGGPEQSAEAVRFPRQGEESNELTVKGIQDVVDKIVAAIQSFVDEKENSITEVVDVPVEQHRNLIGANGATRRQLEEKFGVSLDVPRRDSGKTGVKIVGQPSNVEKAKAHIAGLTKQPEGVTIQVPRAVHHTVSKNGQLFRELNRDGIKVDHSGQKPPPKPVANGISRSRTTNGAMPLITDQELSNSFSWDAVQSGGETDGESGTIPWVITGGKDTSDEAVEKVKNWIESSIERAQVPKWTGYMRLPDPRAHRHVIGRGGATINRIRKNTGCDIQVPKGQQDDDAISIIGDKDAIEAARDAIWEEVQRASEA